MSVTENDKEYVVRRLTPTEAERLQGFPDEWTDIGEWIDNKGKKRLCADTQRYKALGNSIAIPTWVDILQRIAELCPRKTMASLFDGIGGFPLIWERDCKGETLWASEIEPFCIAVTKEHFPNMQHLGSVTDLKGDKVPNVDFVVGGSPCQDLSVAGLRAGLQGERSGLFMEQVRITKEMRENYVRTNEDTNGIFPRFLLWENVPGAISSNGGEDFRIVLEEIAKVKEQNTIIPKPPKGKWANYGSILGNGWSIAWAIRDAQFYGVPQRRRRIALVADFDGECASKILFE